MTKNKTLINLRKMPYQLMLFLLASGASLILGFLSFSGMYALIPVLSLAWSTFALSVAFEGEIYFQNIKGALKKLLKINYLEQRLALDYLNEHMASDEFPAKAPQFFQDYNAVRIRLEHYENKELSTENKKIKWQLQKTLKDMQQWFAQQLVHPQTSSPDYSLGYTQNVQTWLSTHDGGEWLKKLRARSAQFNLVKTFSALAALFMMLGSTYLIVEAFGAIPFFATIPFTTWPLIILPMSVIAGSAYGLLTYNAITDLINNKTLRTWYERLRKDVDDDLKKGRLSGKTIIMTTTALFLSVLAITLTVCTAGTWWTIATKARPLFDWMRHMPSVIMGVINPIITGASAIFFNLENTAESLEMMDKALDSKSTLQTISTAIRDGWLHVRATENWLQLLNPFRIALKLTITPLRILLFFGHLISVSLTSDRMPGVPQIIAALIAIISEGFEDAHYFVSSDGDEHQGTDFPTRLVKIMAMPLYALATGWDVLSSQFNEPHDRRKRVLSFADAWSKHYGIKPEETITLDDTPDYFLHEWRKAQLRHLIDKQISKLAKTTVNTQTAQEKIEALTCLKAKVMGAPPRIAAILSEEQKNPIYNTHRLFAVAEKTATQIFIERLPERIGLNRY